MKRKKYLILLFLIFSVLIINTVATATATTVKKDIEKGLMCYCGCDMVLYSCECADAAQMRNNIEEMLSNGLTKQEIFQTYVDKYGQTILASPPKEGFDLIVWILPGIIILISGFLIWMFIKKSVLSFKAKSKNSLNNEDIEEVEAHEEEIEEEMKKYL